MKKLHAAALFLAVYTLSFMAIVRLGLVSEEVPPFRGVLMFWLVLLAASAIAVLLLVSAVLDRASMDRVRWLGLLSVVLVAVGLWTTRLADFSIDVVLTEGQIYETDAHRSVGLLYAGMLSPVPKFRLLTEGVVVDQERGETPDDARATGRFQLLLPDGKPPRPMTLTQGTTRLQNGMFMTVKGFGYSLRYAMKKRGQTLESDFISMRLLPYGSEDYFRLLSPHTFSVRYDPGHRENGSERPLRVKISRNKDIVFNGYAGLGEDVRFEDAAISFDEIRKWVELSVSRRWGEAVSWTGLGLGCVSLLLMLVRRRRGALRS